LEHVPKKLIDFFDQNMLQLIDVERFLIAWVTAPKRKTLSPFALWFVIPSRIF
jgi:hypothetical protein